MKYKFKASTLFSIILLAAVHATAGAVVKIASQADMQNNPAADPSAVLEIQSTTKGLLIPRLTRTERNEIASPADGLLIYNLDEDCVSHFDSGRSPQWYDYCFSGKVLADITMTEATLTAGNSPAIKTVPYDLAVVNYDDGTGPVFDTGTHVFKAPIDGLYQFRATYGQFRCKEDYWIGIGISQPNKNYQSPSMGDLAAYKKIMMQSSLDCNIPSVAFVTTSMNLNTGDEIFVAGINQKWRYGLGGPGGWNYDDDYQNRFLAIYVGPLQP